MSCSIIKVVKVVFHVNLKETYYKSFYTMEHIKNVGGTLIEGYKNNICEIVTKTIGDCQVEGVGNNDCVEFNRVRYYGNNMVIGGNLPPQVLVFDDFNYREPKQTLTRFQLSVGYEILYQVMGFLVIVMFLYIIKYHSFNKRDTL